MSFLLALTPILLILALMVGLRWSAVRAGAAGYFAALAIAMVYFGATTEVIGYAHVRALLLTVDVLLIIWAAFLLYRVVDEAGAIRTIGKALPYLTPDRTMQALIIGWIFASFLQGVGGFGVPVAVIAPLLVSLGFSPLAAVTIPSLGHGWAVTFGSLGSSFQALIAATGLSSRELAPPAALFLGLSAVPVGWAVAHAAEGWAGVRRTAWIVVLLGGLMALVQWEVVAVGGFWNIGAFCAASAGLLLAFPLARRTRPAIQHRAPSGGPKSPLSFRTLSVALSGYAILMAVTLIVQLVPAITQALSGVTLQVHFPQVTTALGYVTPAGLGRTIVVFRHTGAVLFYSAALAGGVYRLAGCYSPGAERRIITGTVFRVMSSSVSIASMVAMAVIMENSGMTDTLARGLAGGVGRLFPAVAPWIGALGAFMTGSNTNSNVIFGQLQLKTAELLGFSAPLILAGQTAGAALASVLAPTKVVVGASTAGMAGREGEVMRKLIGYTLIMVIFISVLTSATIWLGRR